MHAFKTRTLAGAAFSRTMMRIRHSGGVPRTVRVEKAGCYCYRARRRENEECGHIGPRLTSSAVPALSSVCWHNCMPILLLRMFHLWDTATRVLAY